MYPKILRHLNFLTFIKSIVSKQALTINSFTAAGDNNRLFANRIDPDETAQ